jgi:hypothetical protein
MGAIIGLILFGIPSVIIAGSKGFKPFRWLIAFGLIGLIVVAFMPSAKAAGISPEEAQQRSERANRIGALMTGLNVGLTILLIIVALANS